MLFSSLEFLFIFLPLLCIPYIWVKNIRFRNCILIIFSLIFYAFGEPKAVVLMLASIIVNYTFALLITRFKNMSKILLVVSVIFNLAFLFWYKYTGFFISNVNNIFSLNIEIPVIHLPIGISFFTFQAMSYVIDVYRKDTDVQKNPFYLLLYICLFPQLIAGPIIKYHDIASQIDKRETNWNTYINGSRIFLFGLFKKVLIANSCGMLWESILNSDILAISVATAWIGAIFYAFQIYFDFSGYSDMAIGLGKIFGFDFLANFNYPYISRSIREFWRRWHISLSTWFKEYLYIPLGGNRKGSLRTYINLLIVFFCTGFWHGASWNFIIWGMWHGFFSVAERFFLGKMLDNTRYKIINHIYTLSVVVIGFAIFAITDSTQLILYLKAMFGLNGNGLFDNNFLFILINNLVIIFTAVLLSTPIYIYMRERLPRSKMMNFVYGAIYIALFIVVIANLVGASYNPFLYFRF